MKMTFTEIQTKLRTLVDIGGRRLPRSLASSIARNIMMLEKETEFVESEKKKIVDLYVAKDESGNYILDETGTKYTFDPETNNKEEFIKEINELNNLEVDVNVIFVDSEVLNNCEPSMGYDVITAVEESKIGWMLKYSEIE